jgi:rubrerythrin
MDLKGSETEKNLYKTFAGESRARNKYNFYGEEARAEGYRWVGKIFDETAHNEKAHAREVFKRFLNNVNESKKNLLDSALGEAEESKKIYKEFEETARNEGFNEIADFYKELQEVEESHEKRFLKLAKMLEEDRMFKSSEEGMWQCMNCGYIYEGKEVPDFCPLCKYPKAYFKPYSKEDL